MPPAAESFEINRWNARRSQGFLSFIFAGSPENQKPGRVHLVTLTRGGGGGAGGCYPLCLGVGHPHSHLTHIRITWGVWAETGVGVALSQGLRRPGGGSFLLVAGR